MIKRDILIDKTTLDLTIIGGNFHIGNSELQEALNIVYANKGEYRQHPTLGVGIYNFIGNPSNDLLLNTLIGIELNSDGIFTDEISLDITSFETFDINIQLKK